jgi:Co/Zn/Cd efflux system component
LEVVAGAAGSVGVIIAGALISLTGNGLWDTLVALAIGIFVAVRAVVLGRQVLAVLGRHVRICQTGTDEARDAPRPQWASGNDQLLVHPVCIVVS